MSTAKTDAAARRTKRQAKDPREVPRTGPRKKDTKRWCKGKVGEPHKGECWTYGEFRPDNAAILRLRHWRVLFCAHCHKCLEYYTGRGPKPAWVTR